MESLPINNFLQMKFPRLGIIEPFLSTLGDVPKSFTAYVHGEPGQGKTEFLVQLANHLCEFGKANWVSWEQGFGADLHAAMERNKMNRHSGRFVVTDPYKGKDPNETWLQYLDKRMGKRGSAHIWFFDSLEHSGLSKAEFMELDRKYKEKKIMVWIGHSKGRHPDTPLGNKGKETCQMSIRVSKFIAYVEKNRYNGWQPYVVYDLKARELNPLFFAAQGKSKKVKTKRLKK